MVKKEEKITVEVSARHVHLSKKDLKKLFGKEYELESVKTLSQPGEFAAKETVNLIYGNKKIYNVRIIGPIRKSSQAELSLTDVYGLGMDPLPKLRLSGNTFGTVKVKAEGPKDTIKIPCIIPKRHLHISDTKAKEWGVKNNQELSVRVPGIRGLVFNSVVARVSKNYRTALHLDTDEGNAAGIKNHKGDGKVILDKEDEE